MCAIEHLAICALSRSKSAGIHFWERSSRGSLRPQPQHPPLVFYNHQDGKSKTKTKIGVVVMAKTKNTINVKPMKI